MDSQTSDHFDCAGIEQLRLASPISWKVYLVRLQASAPNFADADRGDKNLTAGLFTVQLATGQHTRIGDQVLHVVIGFSSFSMTARRNKVRTKIKTSWQRGDGQEPGNPYGAGTTKTVTGRNLIFATEDACSRAVESLQGSTPRM